jgi:transcriptional repressor NrdR
VVDSRLAGSAIRRRRECPACGRRFTTYEGYDEGPLYIRKRDGSRQQFDRQKLLAGLERAAIKRPIEREQLEAIVDRIVAELRARGGTPEAADVGELALRGLRELDQVAYVRFASVYRKFADVAEFESELDRLEQEPPLQDAALFDGAQLDREFDGRRGEIAGAARSARRRRSVRRSSQASKLPPKPANLRPGQLSQEPAAGSGRGSARGSSEQNTQMEE